MAVHPLQAFVGKELSMESLINKGLNAQLKIIRF